MSYWEAPREPEFKIFVVIEVDSNNLRAECRLQYAADMLEEVPEVNCGCQGLTGFPESPCIVVRVSIQISVK
jgi:hypothetical protein